jgi:hypothetical protein
MAWWGWLLVAWAGTACVVALWLGAALRLAELREWFRRCGAERRRHPRHPGVQP